MHSIGEFESGEVHEQGEDRADDPAEEDSCIDGTYIMMGEPKKDSER